KIGDVRNGLDVVNAAAVPIVSATDEQTEFLLSAKALAHSAGGFGEISAAFHGGVTAHPADANRRALTCGPCNQVGGAPDAVGIYVGLESFVDFDGFDDVRGDSVKFDLANAGFGRRNIDAVDRGVGETRLSAADLNVFAFTFIALDGNAGETAESVGHVG